MAQAVNAKLADELARKAKALGVTPANAADQLPDVLDIWTGGELDYTEIGLLYDMVLARLPAAKACPVVARTSELNGGPSRDEFGHAA